MINHAIMESLRKFKTMRITVGYSYRQHLANSLKDAGFSLRMVGDGLFEIDGVPDAVLSEFSRRREDIERLMKENGWEGAKLASMATLFTRSGKEVHDQQTLEADWQARAKNLEFDAEAFMQMRGQMALKERWLDVVKDRLSSLFRKLNQPPSEQDAAKACGEIAIETLSQRVSVFSERDLREASLKNSLLYEKAIAHEHIQHAINEQMKAQNLYSAPCPKTQETLLTTPWLLTLEAETIALIEHNKGLMKSIATQEDVRLFQKARAANLAYPMTTSQKKKP